MNVLEVERSGNEPRNISWGYETSAEHHECTKPWVSRTVL